MRRSPARASARRTGALRGARGGLTWTGAVLVAIGLATALANGPRATAAYASSAAAAEEPREAETVADVLALQGEHDRRLAREANALLEEILGPRRARVSVRSTWDLSRSTQHKETPGRSVVVSESRTDTETADELLGGGRTSTESRAYAPTISREERVRSAPELQRLSVALFLDPGALQQGIADTAELRAAIQAAVGFDARRGDEFHSVVLPFAASAVPAPPPAAPAAPAVPLLRWSLELAGAIALLAWLALRRKSAHELRPVPAGPPQAAPGPSAGEPARAAIDEILAADPAKVGQVLSRWAREEPAPSPR